MVERYTRFVNGVCKFINIGVIECLVEGKYRAIKIGTYRVIVSKTNRTTVIQNQICQDISQFVKKGEDDDILTNICHHILFQLSYKSSRKYSITFLK